jgi:hypothetical protein
MSFVYYSLEATFGLPLINAETLSNSFWSTTTAVQAYIQFLTSIDFSQYDTRRIALEYVNKLRVPKFFETYSFDPTAFPLFPPTQQTRFPASDTYILLGANSWTLALQALSQPLAYRDSDGPIDTPKQKFYEALATLTTLYTTRDSFFDRFTFELDNLLIWSIYPPVSAHLN